MTDDPPSKIWLSGLCTRLPGFDLQAEIWGVEDSPEGGMNGNPFSYEPLLASSMFGGFGREFLEEIVFPKTER